jgi:hypothetical protein
MNKLFKNTFLFQEEGGDGGGGGNEPPANQEPPAPLLGEDLSFAPDWTTRLGDDAKDLTFKSLPDLVKSYKSASSQIGKVSNELAEYKKNNPTAEIPADEVKYKESIKLPDKLPEGIHIPENLLSEAVKFGIENKIPPTMVEKFIAFQTAQAGLELQNAKAAQLAAVNTAKDAIIREVGEDKYDVTIANARAAHDLLGLQLDKDDLLSNPRLVTALSLIHSKISPAQLKDLNLTSEGQSATSKLQQAEDIVGNEANPDYAAFHDPTHMNHDAVMQKYNLLIAQSGGR